MANKKTQLPNTENPMDEPGDKKKGSASDFSGEKGVQGTTPQVPGGATGSPSESQKAAADASSGIEVESSEPAHPQMASEQQAVNDSMPPLTEDRQTSTPRDGNEDKTGEAQAKPDSIDDIRRSLKEGDQPEESRALIPGVMDWWARTFPTAGRKSADDAGIDARLDDESLSLHAKPAFEMPSIDEVHVGEVFGELERLAGADAELQQADASVGDATRVERATEPASEVTESETPTRPVEETQDVPRTSYELSQESRGGEKTSESYDNIREAALQDLEEVPPEVDRGGLRSLRESLRRTLKELHPSKRRLLVVGCIVIIGIALIIGAYAITISQPAKVIPTPTATLGVSYPAAITFPGGWDFSLAIGKLQNNKWSPQGAEWLEGTEISRWVSLPWSSQLEAVFRTLKSGDVLVLVMSNSDHLEYKVQSVQQSNVDQMAGIEKKVPSLVVFLANNSSKETWVITAVP